MVLRPLTVIAAAGVVAATALAAPASGTAALRAAAPGPRTPACSWIAAGGPSTNVAFPDTGAVYWVMPFHVQPGLRIVAKGVYPDARYASFNVYDQQGGTFTTRGVGSSLPDHRIRPIRGSVNPWRRAARPGGRFTVTVRSDAARGQVNTLPLAPSGTAAGRLGWLFYRVYLPAGSVRLPTVTFKLNGVSRTLRPCGKGPAALRAPAGAEPLINTPLVFTRGTSGVGNRLFANADAAYLSARVPPPGGNRVVVIRGKAARAVKGRHPRPWPTRGADMRYWSMCSNLLLPPLPVVGCRTDQQTRLDNRSGYTFVVGTERQRAAIAKIPGATFVPFSSARPAAPHLFLLRNLLGDGFRQSIQRVPVGSPAAKVAAIMGPYYPRAKVCALAALTRGRC